MAAQWKSAQREKGMEGGKTITVTMPTSKADQGFILKKSFVTTMMTNK